ARLGERTIWLDADVVQGDGGTRCAAITGCFIALCGALHKLEKKGMFDKLPVNNFVAAVSAGVINGEVLLDLDYEEDSKADVDMNIVMTDSDKFIEIQGAAEGAPFDNKMMNSIIGVARKGIRELLSAQKKVLGKVVDWC
ncbi:MAG: ribonuclease PH, partial [Candidatus Omnitrophota bacterium]|nr:ribonuclease PH [Candidatus Omnitrophota bacterium]